MGGAGRGSQRGKKWNTGLGNNTGPMDVPRGLGGQVTPSE